MGHKELLTEVCGVMLVLLVALALLLPLAGTRPSARVGSSEPRPVVHWLRDDRDILASDRSTLLKAAERHVGCPIQTRGQPAALASIERGTFSDPAGFGVQSVPDAWLMSVIDVPITDPVVPDIKSAVTINLVFDEQQELVCAFTHRGGAWVVPNAPSIPIESIAADRLKWSCSRARTATLVSSVSEVLGLIWAVYGTDPMVAGTIVLRPRLVAFTHPELQGEQVVPVSPSLRLRWIVELRGTVVKVSSSGLPLTGVLAAVDDNNVMECRGTYLR